MAGNLRSGRRDASYRPIDLGLADDALEDASPSAIKGVALRVARLLAAGKISSKRSESLTKALAVAARCAISDREMLRMSELRDLVRRAEQVAAAGAHRVEADRLAGEHSDVLGEGEDYDEADAVRH